MSGDRCETERSFRFSPASDSRLNNGLPFYTSHPHATPGLSGSSRPLFALLRQPRALAGVGQDLTFKRR